MVLQLHGARRNAALSTLEHAYLAAEQVFEGIAHLSEYDRRYSAQAAEHAWLSNITAHEGWADAVTAALYERPGASHARKHAHLKPVSDADRDAAFRHKMHLAADLLRASAGGSKCLRDLRVIRYKLVAAARELSDGQYDAAAWFALSTRHEVAKVQTFAGDFTWHTKLDVVCGSDMRYGTGLIRLLAALGPPSLVWFFMKGRKLDEYRR